jgi:hypothetical protein
MLTPAPAGASVGPAINFSSPAPNEVVSGEVTIAGDASMPGSLDTVNDVSVSLTSGIGAPVPSACDPCSSDHGSSASFSWSPSLSRNGPYQAHVSAGGSQFILGVLDGEATSEDTVSFSVEVKPADPAGVKADANADRTVTVRWSRNTEPDMIGYRVQRKDPGASSFHDLGGAVAQPSTGSTVSVVDAGTAQGGAFVYQVQAIRAGRTGDASSAVGSGFSSTDVSIPLPPGAAPAPPAADGPPQNPAPTPNLSAFLSRGGKPPAAGLPPAASIPDGDFQEHLPFAIPPAGADNKAVALQASSGNGKGRTLLIPVAGGLLLCVIAFHVRRFNGWLAADEARPRRVPNLAQPSDQSGATAALAAPSGPAPPPLWETPAAAAAATSPSVKVLPAEPLLAAPLLAGGDGAPRSPEATKAPQPSTTWTLVPSKLSSPESDDDAKWAEWARPGSTAPSAPAPARVTDQAASPLERSEERPETSDDAWEDAVLAVPGAGRTG